MAIRFASLNDIPTLVDIDRAYHQQSRFKCLSYDAQKLTSSFHSLIQNQSSSDYFFVADDADAKPYSDLIGVVSTLAGDHGDITHTSKLKSLS